MTVRMLRTLLVVGLVCLCFQGPPARAEYHLNVSRACDDAGFAGTAEYLNVSISFEACATAQGYHALIRDTQEVLLELYYDTPTQQAIYLIDGIELGENHTPEELSRMRGVMMSKPIISVARTLYPRLERMGFDYRSNGMVALGALTVGMTEEATPAVAVDCGTCTSQGSQCMGCCGESCAGCTGICTNGCLAHDQCERDGGAGWDLECSDELIQALVSYIGEVIFGIGPCGGSGPGCCGPETGCQDPSGCCDEGYHECCSNQCCSDSYPPSSCP